MIVAGFLKARNEIIREGNIHRVLSDLKAMCQCGVLCDDASSDGTAEVLREFVRDNPRWSLLEVPPAAQDFSNEMAVKQEMMCILHARAAADGAPDWILWLDADEQVADREWLLREMRDLLPTGAPGIKCHYSQLWRSENWARTDQGFDDGVFVKAWRYSPQLSFGTASGTHHQQFPLQVDYARCPTSQVELLHWGNYGKNVVWKAITYAGGLGGVDRHIAFGHHPSESLATGRGFDEAKWSAPSPTYRWIGKSPTADEPRPKPFSTDEIRRVRSLGNLRREKGLFCVVVPTFNRARTLPRALDSLLAQTYDRWVAVVPDDGSTDDTARVMREYQDKDPRIFYARYSTNRGGVAMNEVGMALACEFAEYWSRLGSDDWWGPDKLALDLKALQDADACYGLYTVHRPAPIHGRPAGFGEVCNPPMRPSDIRAGLLAGRYFVSWANVAARCSVLREVRERFGDFVDPRLFNMEDFNFNARVAALGRDFAWRGPAGVDPTPVPLGAAWDSRRPSPVLEAVWTQAPEGGASSPDHAARAAQDEALTRRLIAELPR